MGDAFFIDCASLNDPKGLLQGEGKKVRSIRLKSAADIKTPAVAALIKQATGAHEAAFRDAPLISTLVSAVVAKQQSRRPKGHL